MGKFENQLSRMQSLMTYGLVDESDNKSGNIEFSKVASDGKAYGIIRECNRFYIKVTDADKMNIVESYDYIGGFNNKKDYEYSSYQNALKNFDMKMMSINEATGVYGNATTLNPDKKKEFVVEGTDAMKKELARQRQIMENASRIGLYEDNATHDPSKHSDPEGVKGSNNEDKPYTEAGKADGDKDPKAAKNNPKAQGEPYGDSSKTEKGGSVPGPLSPGKSVALEECGGMCKTCGKPMGECDCGKNNCNEEVHPDEETFNAGLVHAHEMPKTETNKPFEQPVNEEMKEWDKGLPSSAGVGEADTDHNNDPYNQSINEGEEDIEKSVDDEDGDEGEIIDYEGGEGEERNELPAAEDDIDLGTDGEPEGAELSSDELADDSEGGDLEAKISDLEADLASLKDLLGMLDDEESSDEEPIDAPVDDVPVEQEPAAEEPAPEEPAAEPEGGEEMPAVDGAEEFDDGDDEEEDYFPEELDEVKKAFMNGIVESVSRAIMNEERTELHDFGKHPGYRKKPMTLPQTGSDEFKGNRDWNDDSVHNEKPFGSSIGDGKPYSELVKVITDSVISELKKKM